MGEQRRVKAVDARESGARHVARACRTTPHPRQGSALSRRLRPHRRATSSRHRIHEAEGGDLHRWMLLARVPAARDPARAKRGLLDTEAAAEHATGSRNRRGSARGELDCTPFLGARGSRCDRSHDRPSRVQQYGGWCGPWSCRPRLKQVSSRKRIQRRRPLVSWMHTDHATSLGDTGG